MYYTQEQIDRANQADLVSFLQSQGEQLTRAGQEYRWKRHDSLTVRGNKWYRHSQSKGGGPVDFVMEFFGKSFTEAVELLTGEKGAAPPPDSPSPASFSDFRLPPRSDTAGQVKSYLTEARRIDEDVTGFFFSTGDIYEDAAHHNAVFVGRDEDGVPRYAHQRGTAGNFRLDVKGSDKAFNFSYRGAGERLFVFEAPIDLLSFLCLFKKGWQKQSYLICRIYEDNILGKLPDSRYEVLDKQYAREKAELDAEIKELEAKLTEYEKSRNSAGKFIALIDKYEKFEELTPAMVNEFVDKVLVHERDRKGSIQTTQEIEIYFNFVGRYVPPAMMTEPTAEEQAEIDRINRIKDRRHQQYLRRKESGWQRKYEERVKNEKRAKMQAMKEEIRRQDRENGVYATAGSLALEPTIGMPE